MTIKQEKKELVIIDILCIYSDLFPVLSTLKISERTSVEEFRKSNAPCVCLFVVDDISKFNNNDSFVIRGDKHEDIHLARYFLKDRRELIGSKKPAEQERADANKKTDKKGGQKEAEKIKVVDGQNYQRARSLLTSIEKFLKNKELINPILFLGVKKELFEEAKKRKSTKMAILRSESTRFQDSILRQFRDISYPEALDGYYIGHSEKCIKVKHLISIASRNDYPVLIIGDTGTGKELVANAIHKYSRDRRSGHFISVNCGAIPDELFESEIFGYKKGAFTDALFDKKGLWEIADKGTLFLDEIGDLSLRHQVKILRTLTTGYFYRIGETNPRSSDARIIAATNKNLYEMVENDIPSFRVDLFYRLANLTIRTPSLDEHAKDIPAIANKFWCSACGDVNARLSSEVLARLQTRHPWRGNVKELKHFVEKLYAYFGGSIKAEQVDALFEEELNNFLYPSRQQKQKIESGRSDEIKWKIETVERLLNAARKSGNLKTKENALQKISQLL